MSRPIILLIRVYQRTLSPLLGSRCRFEPSCSDYTRVAVARFGVARGVWLGLARIVRCHPRGACGFDPVPHAFRLLPERSTLDKKNHDD